MASAVLGRVQPSGKWSGWWRRSGDDGFHPDPLCRNVLGRVGCTWPVGWLQSGGSWFASEAVVEPVVEGLVLGLVVSSTLLFCSG